MRLRLSNAHFWAYVAAAVACLALCAVLLPLEWRRAPAGVDPASVPFYGKSFGEDPFAPGAIRTADGRFADPARIPTAQGCGACHAQEFKEWSASLHSVSGSDRIYAKTEDRNAEAKKAHHGVELTRYCESCHEPNEMLAGRVNPITSVEPGPASGDGVGCITCHATVHARPEDGNGALTVAVNGTDAASLTPLLLAAPREHALAMGAERPLLKSSELCGGCHTQSDVPGIAEVERTVFTQTVYAEWRESWYAQNGVTCQGCHMARDPAGFIAALRAGEQKPVRQVSHAFTGANYLLTDVDRFGDAVFFLRGGIPAGLTGAEIRDLLKKSQHERTTALLKAAAGIEVAAAEFGPEGKGVVTVRVRNSGSGHALPAGVTDQKQIWLQLTVSDGEGRVVYDNGAFDAVKGAVPEGAVIWRERFQDRTGNEIPDHITFRTHTVSHTRPPIPARGEDVVPYDIELPAGASGPLRVTARLWYRAMTQEIVARSLRSSTVMPPFLMAEASRTVGAVASR